MKYHNITHDDMLNGEGLRVVLWISGCEHRCHKCHNPITWDIENGLIFDDNAKDEIFKALDKDYIKGITFSGGDPLHTQNREEIKNFIKEIKRKFENKDIWLYTGYEWDAIKNLDFIKFIDVLIDGKFVESLKDDKLMWRGSKNQNVIDVKKSLIEKKLIKYC